eukprot:TRINITY_DN19693_c2_g1_i1.p1 TRINITY_DN19693_c2_g1~~TRINITY_DN19693_c2_g1_i1.p1  ORF type:complete len:191 (-),score=47.14 TRINITY_DN19693_c2_g1_i1:290-862(-)
MFQCRMCTENPFSMLFGEQPPKDNHNKSKKKAARSSRASGSPSQRDESSFQPRSDEEVKAIMQEWAQYAHPRAREFFATSGSMDQVFSELAKGIDKNDDPVLGPEDKCVYWYGNVTKEDLQAAIRMVKPGESNETVTYVNRVLAFVFATDDSFEQLMRLPKEPFKMSCGDQLCVNLGHIALDVSVPSRED